MELPEILTPQQVSKYLQVNLETVYRLVKDGRIPAFRVGRVWRFHRIDIERYITYQYHAFGPEAAKNSFYRQKVLEKYLNDHKKYYIFDEAFSGRLGSKELYQDWKENKIVGKEAFVEVKYKKVRYNTATIGQPVYWEILVVISPDQQEKISSDSEEYTHWEQYVVHHLSLPPAHIP